MSQRRLWLAAAVALVAAALGWILAPSVFPHAWLAAFVGFSLWPLGSMALLLIHALTGGRWGEALRPGLLAGSGATVLLLPLVLPALFVFPALYPWARPDVALPNRFWLNLPVAAIRGAIYLVTWLGLAAAILRGANLARLAPFALPALALTVTFAAIDGTMSLDPRFTSSAYGMIAGAGGAVLALSAAILASPAATPEVNDGIGRLLLALCALWTYLDFMQVLIVWQNDLPTAVPWYLARTAAGWGWVMAAIALTHGVLPILALLSPTVRRTRLVPVAILLVAAEIMRSVWTVLPAAARAPGLLDLCCLLFMTLTAIAWTRRHHG